MGVHGLLVQFSMLWAILGTLKPFLYFLDILIELLPLKESTSWLNVCLRNPIITSNGGSKPEPVVRLMSLSGGIQRSRHLLTVKTSKVKCLDALRFLLQIVSSCIQEEFNSWIIHTFSLASIYRHWRWF